MFQLTIWSVPALVAAALASYTLYRVRRYQDVPGVWAIQWLAVFVGIWSFGQLLGSVVTDIDAKLLAAKLQYLGIAFTPLAWFAFALTYARQHRRPHMPTMIALSIVPVLSILLAWTNELHHLVWSSSTLLEHDGYIGMVVDYGPWFTISAVYGYATLFTATVMLGYVLSESTRYRKPLVAIMAAPIVTAALNLLYLSPWNPSPWFDATPLGFALAALLLNDGVLRFGLLDLRRVLRHKVVEELSDGVIIVSHNGLVIDINPSAMRILGIDDGGALNRNATSLIPSPAIPDMLNQRRSSCEISLVEGSFHVIATPLASDDAGREQMALVFRDITDRRDQELTLKRVKHQAERLAQTDPLTGLHNRRYFMRRLNEEIERVKRQGYALSVLVLDLDYFKHVNDTHGHDVGDRVLRVIANVCDEVKRVTDVCSRIGGEEFAVLLPDTKGPGALKLAQRLRETIFDQFIAAAAEEAPPIRVTASIGVATVSRHSPYLEHVLSQADQALYQAKNDGRNTVRVAD